MRYSDSSEVGMDFGVFKNYEVAGRGLVGYLSAFRAYPTVGEKYLSGLRKPNGEMPTTAELMEMWFPLQTWLTAHHQIVADVGASTSYSIGKKVAETADVPPEVNSVAQVLSSIDIVYHLFHRKDGVVMFDPATGKMTEGIG